MKRVILKNLPNVLLIGGLVAVAGVVALYVLNEQRLRFPLIEDKPLRYEMTFSKAAAVTPGQGQTVQVAGVAIGSIASVELHDGRAVVGVDIEREHRRLLRVGSRALLRPRTGLKDMYIQLFPALDQPVAEPGYRIPVENTLPDVDLHDILAQLDDRTRDYVRLLASGLARGLEGRGTDLSRVFRRFRPTYRDLARVNRAVARERTALRRLVTSLARLNERLARNPRDLTELVDNSAATFRAFASEDDNLRATLTELAPTLTVARRALRNVRPFAQELGPATRALIPALRALDRANPRLAAFARQATPAVRDQIRPFVGVSRPVVRDLRPAAAGLSDAFPELRRDLSVLNRFFNMLGHNPEGREPPDQRDREEGYLFWLAWVGHQTINLINTDDANGPLRATSLTGTCTTLETFIKSEGADAPLAEAGFDLSALFANLCGDPDGPSVSLDELLKVMPAEVIALLPRSPLEKVDKDASAKIDAALAKAEAKR